MDFQSVDGSLKLRATGSAVQFAGYLQVSFNNLLLFTVLALDKCTAGQTGVIVSCMDGRLEAVSIFGPGVFTFRCQRTTADWLKAGSIGDASKETAQCSV